LLLLPTSFQQLNRLQLELPVSYCVAALSTPSDHTPMFRGLANHE
jgi:hypothetical protein